MKRVLATVAWSLFGLSIWLAQVRWPCEPASPALDPSWQQALSYALTHGIRFGRELVFSFGPLGGPQHARYEPELFWPQILLFEFLFKGLLARRWITALRRFASMPDRIVFGLALVSVAVNADVFMLATVAVLGSNLLRDAPPPKWERALDCVLLFAIGYVKFTYFVFVLVVCAAFVLDAAFRSRRAGWKALVGVVLVAVAVWCACLQRPWDLPLFVWRSWQLASGYSESQAFDGEPADRTRASACLVVTALMLCLYVFSSPSRRKAGLVAGCASFGVFVAFKASFTFHVQGAPTFFGFVILVPIVLVLEERTPWIRRALLAVGRLGLVLLALDGYTRGLTSSLFAEVLSPGLSTLAENARGLWELPALREKLEAASRKSRERFALPRMKAIVRNSTVDFVGVAQGYIFQNEMRWKPRPVFQSYAATTSELIGINGDFLASDEAPEFVMFQTATLLRRIPGSEDADVQRILMRMYRLVCRERGVLLFQRDPSRASRPPPEKKTVAEIEARPDEWVSLDAFDDPLLVARFDIRYSLRGILRRQLVHAAITYIDVKTQAGDVSTWRLVPGQARAGVTMRPWVPFEEDWIRLYAQGPESSISAFRVRSGNDWNALYQPTYRVTVEALADSLPDPQVDEWAFLFDSFATRPLLAESRTHARYRYAQEQEIVLVDPDTRLVFAVDEGAQRVTGCFGLWPESIAISDGVDFRVALVAASGTSREIFARTLDRTASDARRSCFDVAFEARMGERLVIETSNPPGRTAVNDLPYLKGIRIGR